MALPQWSLRGLTLLTRVDTTDAYHARVPGLWVETVITGWLEPAQSDEDHEDGRQAEVSGWRLFTNAAHVKASDRIVDGASTYDVIGAPRPYRSRAGVDHYEATLRLVNG